MAQTILDDHVPCLSFRLPQLDRTFLAEGEVVWRSESSKSAGLRFVNLDERDRVQIRNWIRAEIVSMEFETALEASPVSREPVLIMPSPRKVASTWAQSEAERDEARAAEFDRMFPSEATLALQAQAPVEIVEPEFNFLAESSEAEDVEIAAEAFHAAQEEHHAGDETDVSEAALGEIWPRIARRIWNWLRKKRLENLTGAKSGSCFIRNGKIWSGRGRAKRFWICRRHFRRRCRNLPRNLPRDCVRKCGRKYVRKCARNCRTRRPEASEFLLLHSLGI